MFKNYHFTTCVIELLAGAKWHTMRETASRGEARLMARLIANEYPRHAVRVREIVRGK